MNKTKTALVIIVLLVVLPSAEILRERSNYKSYVLRLEAASSELRPGASKQQVLDRLGQPDFLLGQNIEWHAGKHQGWLREKLPGHTVKGHYTLAIEFDYQNKIVRIWGGIN